ncbi:MAG TPA: hypothetical protein VGO04_13765 [Ensifer sp.]|jgi:hemerythrin-like domain-containing protein|uniref:hypothetical protein n=1 Tax=Ensifer sp. TaxID=1872086 RepID=UPI002E15BB5F|nr:hypothetical protein [Ensifer sp.]
MSAQPSAQPADDLSPEHEIEADINEMIAEHGSERAAIRALLHDLTVLMEDADRSTSRDFLSVFVSAGARPMAVDNEP